MSDQQDRTGGGRCDVGWIRVWGLFWFWSWRPMLKWNGKATKTCSDMVRNFRTRNIGIRIAESERFSCRGIRQEMERKQACLLRFESNPFTSLR